MNVKSREKRDTQIFKMVNDGYQIKDLTEIFDLTRVALGNILNKIGRTTGGTWQEIALAVRYKRAKILSRLGYPISKIADLLNLSPTTISYWLRGKRNSRTENLPETFLSLSPETGIKICLENSIPGVDKKTIPPGVYICTANKDGAKLEPLSTPKNKVFFATFENLRGCTVASVHLVDSPLT